MKNSIVNKQVNVLLQHFLKNTWTTPEELLSYMRRLGNAKRSATALLGFLVFLIGTHGMFLGWNWDEYGMAIQVWQLEIMLFMILFLVVLFQLAKVMVGDQEYEFGDKAKCFKKARRSFKKHFGLDVLAVRDASLLGLEVRNKLESKAKEVKALNGKSGQQWEKSQELRKMWDAGNYFVNVPSYEALFA